MNAATSAATPATTVVTRARMPGDMYRFSAAMAVAMRIRAAVFHTGTRKSMRPSSPSPTPRTIDESLKRERYALRMSHFAGV